MDSLYYLHKDFAKLPRQARRAELAGVITTGWKLTDIEALDCEIKLQTFRCHVKSIDGVHYCFKKVVRLETSTFLVFVFRKMVRYAYIW